MGLPDDSMLYSSPHTYVSKPLIRKPRHPRKRTKMWNRETFMTLGMPKAQCPSPPICTANHIAHHCYTSRVLILIASTSSRLPQADIPMGQHSSRLNPPPEEPPATARGQQGASGPTHQPTPSASTAHVTHNSSILEQNLRRRRSSSNTVSSLPPSRRRRIPNLRFWQRSTEGDNNTTTPSSPANSQSSANAADTQLMGSGVTDSDSLSNRFIEELDDIASHLSHTLQHLPSPSTTRLSSQPRTSLNSDLSSAGPISFEHQTEMLSRLLEVAATSTVMTLMGSSSVNGRRFDNTSSAENNGSDTTFQEFIASLRHGLLTTELSRNYEDHSSDNMTFFRAFRFDNSSRDSEQRNSTHTDFHPSTRFVTGSSDSLPANSTSSSASLSLNATDMENVPVMIIGVRAVQQGIDSIDTNTEDEVDWFVRGSQSRDIAREETPATGQSQHAATSSNTSTSSSPSTPHRREDVQEPLPPHATQRSWVIFVMGNSFTGNHPLLSAPSLMNENPTYEDLLNLQELIGQVKPQVATKEELKKHDDQLFELQFEKIDNFTAKTNYRALPYSCSVSERCQICLTDYENHDIVRKLSRCLHFYHQDCIDTWLLTGKNNCPLCRSEAVTGVM